MHATSCLLGQCSTLTLAHLPGADHIIRIASSILQAQWPAVFVLHVCEIMNAKLHIFDG